MAIASISTTDIVVKLYMDRVLTSMDIKDPGLNVLPPGVERYVVNGGGLTGFQIFAED